MAVGRRGGCSGRYALFGRLGLRCGRAGRSWRRSGVLLLRLIQHQLQPRLRLGLRLGFRLRLRLRLRLRRLRLRLRLRLRRLRIPGLRIQLRAGQLRAEQPARR